MNNKKAIRLLNFPFREWNKTERNAKKEYLDSNSNYWNCSTQSSTHNKELRREIEQKKKRAHIERELKVMDFDLY